MRYFILCAALLCLASFCVAENLVPLIAWSNSDSFSSASSSDTVIYDVLSKVSLDDLSVAVVLKAKKLSFDDIAKYAGVYGEENTPLSSIQSFLSTSESSLSTGVNGEPASDITNYLSIAMGIPPLYITEISQFPKMDNGKQFVIVVEMPEGSGEEMFRTHDSIMLELKSLLQISNLPHAIFYTSDRESSQHLTTTSNRQRRSVRDENEYNLEPKCYEVKDQYNSSCVVFCFTNPIIEIWEGNSTSIVQGGDEESIRYERGSCNSTESLPEEFQTNVTFAYIVFNVEGNVTEGEPQVRKSLVFTFENGTCGSTGNDIVEDNGIGCGFWTMKLFAGDNPEETTEFRRYRSNQNIFTKLSLPVSVSYACGNNSLNHFVSATSASNDSYKFFGLQVQAFGQFSLNKYNDFVFGSAYHCQGYFDSVSWMGIISVLLLIVIFYIAIVFALSIESLETFDDPRSPTITVENLH